MRRAIWIFMCVAAASSARADFPCDELWAERNAVYADAGYCFRTQRAIQAFGNADCRFNDIRDVPLSARDRAKVQAIARDEQRHACPQ